MSRIRDIFFLFCFHFYCFFCFVSSLPLQLYSGISPNRCLDVNRNSLTPGELVQIWSCNQGDNQRWDLQTNIQSQIRVYNGQRCLNIINQTIIISDICNNIPSQIWKRSDDGSIVSILNGKCMEVTSSTTGTRVTLATCNASLQQRWALGDNKVTSDTFPPTSPTNLVITNLQCRSATLTWKAAADNVGVTAYDIYHDGQLMVSVAGSVLSTALTLVPGVNWGFYVNARDAAGGVSQASASLYVQVPQCSIDTIKPSTPTNVRGAVSGTTITLNWVASSDNVGVIAYDIYRNDIKVGSTSTLTYVDSSLATNTIYTYTIVARDAQSNISPKSTSITLTTAAACSNAICEVKQMTTDTDIPWGLITLPDDTIMYARRDAQDIIRLNTNNGQKTTVGIVPNVKGTDGEGGLLGLAVTPNFPSTDPWIYIYHTSATDNRIVRIKYNNDTIKIDPSSVQILLSGIGRNKYHNGGRLRFGPDGYLYATTGDAQNGNYAQDINNLAGKILRLKQDGSIPSDNPFGNYVWSYGHRNPQGLAFDSQGRLWEQEFGNSIMDETNLIIRGGNYGWPACEGTRTISGTGCSTPGYIAPKKTYTTAEGSCSGIAIVSDVLYVACQRGTRMYREVISRSSLINIQQYFIGTYGRLRTIEPSRDGGLWLTTTNKGDKDNIANNSDEKIFKIILGSGGTATSNSADVSSSPDPADSDVVLIPSSTSPDPFPQWGYVIIVVTILILILTIVLVLLLVRRRRQKHQIHVQTCNEDGEMQMNSVHSTEV